MSRIKLLIVVLLTPILSGCGAPLVFLGGAVLTAGIMGSQNSQNASAPQVSTVTAAGWTWGDGADIELLKDDKTLLITEADKGAKFTFRISSTGTYTVRATSKDKDFQFDPPTKTFVVSTLSDVSEFSIGNLFASKKASGTVAVEVGDATPTQLNTVSAVLTKDGNVTYTFTPNDKGVGVQTDITPGTYTLYIRANAETIFTVTITATAGAVVHIQVNYPTATPTPTPSLNQTPSPTSTPTPTPAPTISNFVATPSTTSGRTIDLTWDNLSDATSYKLYRSTVSTFEDTAGTLVGDNVASPYSDSSLTPGTTYYYDLVAYGGGNSISRVGAQATATLLWTTELIDSPTAPFGYINDFALRLDNSNKAYLTYKDTLFSFRTNASGSWITTTISSDQDLTGGRAMALDSAQKAHVAYYGTGVGWSNLFYGTNTSGTWNSVNVPSNVGVGSNSDIAMDNNGFVHISSTGGTGLFYITNRTGAWVVEMVDAGTTFMAETRIALDGNGKVHIAYMNTSTHSLQYATNVSGNWVVTAVDSQNYVKPGVGMALDGSGKVHIAYNTATGLYYATNISGNWISTKVDNTGETPQIGLDPTGNIHIVHSGAAGVRYATNAYGGEWSSTLVKTNSASGGGAAMALDSTGKPHLVYFHDGKISYSVLK